MRGKSFNHLPTVIKDLPHKAELLVEKVTTDVAAGAGATAPVDTGALAESYTANVEGLHGEAGTNMEYGPYVEYGTIHSAAQPHLGPSAIRVSDAMGGYAKDFGESVEDSARGR